MAKTIQRIYALDALRGIAILLMTLSGLVPWVDYTSTGYDGSFTKWVFHAQCFKELAGITWVDYVFPFFLFSMGAAIPIALSRRIARGATASDIWVGLLKRFFLLIFFSILNVHFRHWTLVGYDPKDATTSIWLIVLFGFLIVFPIWGKFPFKLSRHVDLSVRWIAGLSALFIMNSIHYAGDTSFTVFRINSILHTLALMAFAGGLCWYYTRKSILMRLFIMVLAMGFHISLTVPGDHFLAQLSQFHHIPFVKSLWANAPLWLYDFSWLFHWENLRYLLVIIPATIIGDLIIAPSSSEEKPQWTNKSYIAIASILTLNVLLIQVGLFERYVGLTFVLSAISGITVLAMMKNSECFAEHTQKKSFIWGLCWLMIGLMLEPFEGGIKKEPATLSYLFVTTGLAVYTFCLLRIIVDHFGFKRLFSLIIANGQNPMIAYIADTNFIRPVMGLTGLYIPIFFEYSINNPWPGLAISCFLTLIVAILVAIFTRYKIFLKT